MEHVKASRGIIKCRRDRCVWCAYAAQLGCVHPSDVQRACCTATSRGPCSSADASP